MNDEYTHSTQSPLEGPKYITMNDEYTHSTQSPLEGPKYIKKYVQNQNGRTSY